MLEPVDDDPFKLARFVDAQAPLFDHIIDEIRRGRKETHWMWFVFPQIRGLGLSPTAVFYAMSSLEEARAFLAHPTLGPRLHVCTEAMLAHAGRLLREILGSPDDMKFRSSMTLFAQATGTEDIYQRALDEFCDGRRDERTLTLITEG